MARIIINGRATADLELKFTGSGKAFGNLNVADNKRRKNPQSGEWEDEGVTFYRVPVWEAQAEALAEESLRGRRVLVSGDLHQREYERSDGTKGYSLEVSNATVALLPAAQAARGRANTTAPYSATHRRRSERSLGDGAWNAAPANEALPF